MEDPQVLLLGLPKSGKTSIRRVVLDAVKPHHTATFAATTRIETTDAENDFVKFHVVDVPGQLQPDLAPLLKACSAVIFVVDCSNVKHVDSREETFLNAVQSLGNIVVATEQERCRRFEDARERGLPEYEARKASQLWVEVFLHKMDRVAEQHRASICRTVEREVETICQTNSIQRFSIEYHQSSIFTYSIFAAFSTVIQRIVPQVPAVQQLLAQLAANSRLSDVALFDAKTQLCIAAEARADVVRAAKHGTLKPYTEYASVVGVLTGFKKANAAWADNEAPSSDTAAGNTYATGYPQQTQALLATSQGTDREGRKERVVYCKAVSQHLILLATAERDAFTDSRALIEYNVDVAEAAIRKTFFEAPHA